MSFALRVSIYLPDGGITNASSHAAGTPWGGRCPSWGCATLRARCCSGQHEHEHEQEPWREGAG